MIELKLWGVFNAKRHCAACAREHLYRLHCFFFLLLSVQVCSGSVYKILIGFSYHCLFRWFHFSFSIRSLFFMRSRNLFELSVFFFLSAFFFPLFRQFQRVRSNRNTDRNGLLLPFALKATNIATKYIVSSNDISQWTRLDLKLIIIKYLCIWHAEHIYWLNII